MATVLYVPSQYPAPGKMVFPQHWRPACNGVCINKLLINSMGESNYLILFIHFSSYLLFQLFLPLLLTGQIPGKCPTNQRKGFSCKRTDCKREFTNPCQRSGLAKSIANNKTCPGGRLENAKLSLLQTGEEGPGKMVYIYNKD